MKNISTPRAKNLTDIQRKKIIDSIVRDLNHALENAGISIEDLVRFFSERSGKDVRTSREFVKKAFDGEFVPGINGKFNLDYQIIARALEIKNRSEFYNRIRKLLGLKLSPEGRSENDISKSRKVVNVRNSVRSALGQVDLNGVHQDLRDLILAIRSKNVSSGDIRNRILAISGKIVEAEALFSVLEREPNEED